MLGFVLFIRTLAVASIVFVCSGVVDNTIIRILRSFGLVTSRTMEGLIGVGILISAWIIYRLYFQQYLYLDDDDE